VESSTDHCLAFDTDWPSLIDTYDVDVVFAIASLAEQWDQKYTADDRWHSPGSAGYNVFHDTEMVAMSTMLDSLGVPLLVADAPFVRADTAGFYGRENDRVDAWNATIARWDQRWPNVLTVPFAQWFADPNSGEGMRQRPDGVHVTTEFAEAMTTEHLLDAFRQRYELVLEQSAAWRSPSG
jgi:hypothetical protein